MDRFIADFELLSAMRAMIADLRQSVRQTRQAIQDSHDTSIGGIIVSNDERALAARNTRPPGATHALSTPQ